MTPEPHVTFPSNRSSSAFGSVAAQALPGSDGQPGHALPPRESDGPELRYGFSFGHLRALARRALRDHRPSRGMDPEDRFEAFGGRTRIASTDLLARLPAADPGRYGDWDLKDLSGILRRHGVTRHKINIDGDRRNKRWGHWLEDITSALTDLAAPAAPAGQAARSPAA